MHIPAVCVFVADRFDSCELLAGRAFIRSRYSVLFHQEFPCQYVGTHPDRREDGQRKDALK